MFSLDNLRMFLLGDGFPFRLHFSFETKECDSVYFVEGHEFRGVPAFSSGFAWYIAVRRIIAEGVEKIQFGFRILPFPCIAGRSFNKVNCSGIVKAGECIKLQVEKDIFIAGDDAFHPYESMDLWALLADGGTGIVSTVITVTDATEQPKPQPAPARTHWNKKKGEQDEMKKIIDGIVRPKMHDDGTVEFGNYVHFEEPLGKGGFGTVYAGYRRNDELPVAVKVMHYTGRTDLAAAEITILKDLAGVTPHLVSVVDVCLAPSQVYLVMELCNIGDLDDYIQSTTDKKLPEAVIRHFLKHLIIAMRVLREKNIVHRDLKPQNLLLHNYTHISHPSAHDLTLKVADFGLSRYLADDSFAKSLLGTREYVAPEVVEACLARRPGNYTPSVDLWSIGVILYECLIGSRPSLDVEGEPILVLPLDTSTPLEALIKGLLRTNAQKRMTFPDFFNNEFCKIVDALHDVQHVPAQPDDKAGSGTSNPQRRHVHVQPVSPARLVPPPARLLLAPSTSSSAKGSSGWTDTSVKELLKGWEPKAVVAVVVKDYTSTDPGEINLRVGDLVTDIEQMNAGWWRGACRGKRGTFPAKHVEQLRGRKLYEDVA
ncbi:ATG1 transcript variant A [Aphelenchoides avenae]|nr:ATG1 transcript variant A [Aphelenchus avenae]